MALAEKTLMGDGAKEAVESPPLRPSSSIQHGVATELGLPVSKDIGEDLFREIDDYTPEELEAERIRVRKLIDWRIMPIVSLSKLVLGESMAKWNADLHHIHHSISRQTISQLCLRIQSDPGSRTPRSKILLGRRYFQLRLPVLGNPCQPVDPTIANCKIHRYHDHLLGCPLDCTCRREELRWNASSPLPPGNVRSLNLTGDHEYMRHVLYSRRTTIANVYLPCLQRNGHDGRSPSRFRTWPCNRNSSQIVAAHLSNNWVDEFRLGSCLPLAHA